MGRNGKEFTAPTAEGQAPQSGELQSTATPEFMPSMEMMTPAGVTFAEFCDQVKVELATKDAAIVNLKDEVAELVADNAAKADTIATLNVDLAVARVVSEDAKTIAGSLQRLPDGGLRLMVTLDADSAVPLMSWADGAGEDPATYIQKVLEDALVAVVSS